MEIKNNSIIVITEIIVIFLLMTLPLASSAETKYSVPKELKLENSGTGYDNERFFPVGWSPEGKFAFVLQSSDPGNGGKPTYKYYILDTMSDSYIFSSEKGNASGQKDDFSLDNDWIKNSSEFQSKMRSNKIAQSEIFVTETSPFSSDGQKYYFRIYFDKKEKTEYNGPFTDDSKNAMLFGKYDRYLLKIWSKDKGTRIIANRDISPGTVDVKICCFVKSQFNGKRAAILRKSIFTGSPVSEKSTLDIIGISIIP